MYTLLLYKSVVNSLKYYNAIPSSMIAKIEHSPKSGAGFTCTSIYGDKRRIISDSKHIGLIMGSARVKITYSDGTVVSFVRRGSLYYTE